MWDPTADAWLAGFADGEATFLLNHHHSPRWGKPSVNPRFSINLRADDVAVLRQLCDAFGGRVVFDQNRGFARYFWRVTSKADLARLVAYFDQFPLRAKKAADYAIWRAAVTLYTSRGGVEPYEQLIALREALIAGRAYTSEPTSLRAVS